MRSKQLITVAIAGAALLLCAAALFLLEPGPPDQAALVERPSLHPPPPPAPPPQPPKPQDWGIRSDPEPPSSARACVDSDAGAPHQGVFVPGTTEEGGVLGRDHCSEPNTLVEYFCFQRPRGPEQRRWYGLRYHCPGGCAGGACRGGISAGAPSVSQLNGSRGTWRACRGTGAHVCAEMISPAYPSYWRNHPECIINFDCGGQHFTCNAACPQPSDADR